MQVMEEEENAKLQDRIQTIAKEFPLIIKSLKMDDSGKLQIQYLRLQQKKNITLVVKLLKDGQLTAIPSTTNLTLYNDEGVNNPCSRKTFNRKSSL